MTFSFSQPSLVPRSGALDASGLAARSTRVSVTAVALPSCVLRTDGLDASRLAASSAHGSNGIVKSIHIDPTAEFQRQGGPLRWWGILAISLAATLVIVAFVVVVLWSVCRVQTDEGGSSSGVDMPYIGAGRIKTIELTNDWSTERTETVSPATWDDY